MTVTSQADTGLRRACEPLVQAHPGLSGVFALEDGLDAFAARMLLAGTAERTLDIQCYIWRDDMSGRLLFEALERAAERGVRVRLLLDDNNTGGIDSLLAALDRHPNIEIRLFNPFRFRRFRALGYLTDFRRMNRRMHNKSFTADSQITIVGGRNVGDEYFGAHQDVSFVDLDVMAIGPVVQEMSRDFERYWECELSQPVSRVLSSRSRGWANTVPAELDPAARQYIEAVAAAPFMRDLMAGNLRLEWAAARMLSDDPRKGLGRAKDDRLLLTGLKRLIKEPARELQLISAYFVPGKEGVRDLIAFAREGVKITILTNALEATDVPPVHAGYAKRRKPLLLAGITLFEMKRSAANVRRRGSRLMGSSALSLHAKTFQIDGSRVFIGSFNFDPRSARLNTELGFVIDSAAMAAAIQQAFATRIAAQSYLVRFTESGLQWVEQDGTVHNTEPGSPWRRFVVEVLEKLPIEWLL